MTIFKKVPKQIVLLIALLFFIFGAFFLTNTIFGNYFLLIFLSVILLSEFSIIEKKNKVFKTVVVVASLFNLILPLSIGTEYIYPIYIFIIIVFFYTVGHLLFQITTERKVNAKLIIDSISGYLLLGVVITLLNELAFMFDKMPFGSPRTNIGDAVYYSFVTLTTIGFGDISPASSFAKAVSVFGGIVGQLYLTIVIAFIVGKFHAKSK